MGTPYRWGGSDQNGFDCSGLIQYAYDQIGIKLPRSSREQALAGSEVPRAIGELAAGDILVFADAPGSDQVSHVGLYLGDGTFIHSASGGVKIGSLRDGDPDSRWWQDRWLGARRILD
jgi:cell wall-associated NlpC family hydrolase